MDLFVFYVNHSKLEMKSRSMQFKRLLCKGNNLVALYTHIAAKYI